MEKDKEGERKEGDYQLNEQDNKKKEKEKQLTYEKDFALFQSCKTLFQSLFLSVFALFLFHVRNGA